MLNSLQAVAEAADVRDRVTRLSYMALLAVAVCPSHYDVSAHPVSPVEATPQEAILRDMKSPS